MEAVLSVVLILSSLRSVLPSSPYLGIAPKELKYFAGEVTACRDGSGTFKKDRLNDGFCDCPDGTDEPGTSACPEGRFYCRNQGSSPELLFSSRVNDRICDCCDGSDEYDGYLRCPNTCVKDGSVVKESDDNNLSIRKLNDFGGGNNRSDDLFQRIKELRMAMIVEFALVISLAGFCLRSRIWAGRRRYR